MKKEIYRKSPPPDYLERPIKRHTNKQKSKYPELNIMPELHGLRDREKSIEDLSECTFFNKDVRYDEDFTLKLKLLPINERLKWIYIRFWEYEYLPTNNAESDYSISNNHRFTNRETKNKITFAEFDKVIVVRNQISQTVISYHPAFTTLLRVETPLIVENFKKYIKSLNLKDYKEKKMRGTDNGFIYNENYLIIWNKFGEKKNGNAFISKLIFTNKE